MSIENTLIKQHDLTITVSNDNAKSEAKLTVTAKFYLPESITKEMLEEKCNMVCEVYRNKKSLI